MTGQTAQSWSTTEAATTNRLKLTSGNVCTGTKAGLCYDAAGNLIFDNQLGSGGDRTYDAEGRILTAAGGGTNKYVYDADGKRVRRQVGSAQYWQVYGIGGELVAEYLWDGTTATLQKEYGYSGEVAIVAENAATVWWLVKDHLGTPRMLADQTGSLGGIRRHDYSPFGEENLAGPLIRTTTNGYQAEGVRQKFTGDEHDSETGLEFAQARYLSSLQGRFTSVDPLHSSAKSTDPQSWNRYAYVGNRPLVVTDPSGLQWAYNKGKDEYKWFDKLTDEDIADGWKAVASFSYYAGSGIGYVALNPLKNEWKPGYASKEEAENGSIALAIATDQPQVISTAESADEMSMFLGGAGIVKSLAKRTLFKIGAMGAEEAVTLYRGVNESHVAFDAALDGVVRPNKSWWQFWKSGSSALEHNATANGTLNSPFTSWTTDPSVALNFALRPNGGGVLLEATISISRTVASPNAFSVGLRQGGGVVSEAEVLVKGIVTGAKATKVP